MSGAPGWSDPHPHESRYAEVNGVRINYLDFGGGGPPLVLIHGIGDDPHLFDDLASLLRGRFRIVAYARRGHGRSDSPAGPYDAATLVEDLRRLLDRLGIARASLLGWSMGGNEITAFAGGHPERVDRLVYLEAGYDWSAPEFCGPFEEILGAVEPRDADLASLDAIRAWFRATWLGDSPWTPGLEAYIRDAAQPDSGGSLHPAPRPEVFRELLATLRSWRRDYTKVRAPALALYSTTAFFPTERIDAALTSRLRDFERLVAAPFRRASMDRLRRELRDATIHEVAGCTHMSIGVRRPEEPAGVIRDFLAR